MSFIEGPTLTFSPVLAEKIGINAAIVLHQLHHELLHSPLQQDGHTWFIHTYDKWQKQFPFWSKDTIIRIFLKLETEGFIISTDEYNTTPFDRRKWYRVNYEKIASIHGITLVQRTVEYGHNANCKHAFKETGNMSHAKLQDTNTESTERNMAKLQDTHTENTKRDMAKLQDTNTENPKWNMAKVQDTNTQSTKTSMANIQVTNSEIAKTSDANSLHASSEITNTSNAKTETASPKAFNQNSTMIQTFQEPSMQNHNMDNRNLPTQNNIKQLVVNIIHNLNKQANKNYNPHLMLNT